MFSSFCFMHVPDFYNKRVLLLKQIISIKKFKTSRGKRDGPVEGSSGRIAVRGNGFSLLRRKAVQPCTGGVSLARGPEGEPLQQGMRLKPCSRAGPPAVAPEAVAPEAVAPEAVASEAVAPEAVASEAVAPEAVAPEAVAPEAEAPEARPAVVPAARVSAWAASTGRDRPQGHRRDEWGACGARCGDTAGSSGAWACGVVSSARLRVDMGRGARQS